VSHPVARRGDSPGEPAPTQWLRPTIGHIAAVPATVHNSVAREGCPACASGRMLLVARYNRNPAKEPRYNPTACGGNGITVPSTAPTTGAIASSPSSSKALFRAFPYRVVTVNVLKPSAKSCPATATTTEIPTAVLAWNPTPMPNPSRRLCTTSAAPAVSPTEGAWCECALKCSSPPRCSAIDHSTTCRLRNPATVISSASGTPNNGVPACSSASGIR